MKKIFIIGFFIIIFIIVFDILWFSFEERESDRLYYEVLIEPSSDDLYTIRIPTLVYKSGDESGLANQITTKNVTILHVNSLYGKSLEITTSGKLQILFKSNHWSGSPSLTFRDNSTDYVRIYINSTQEFNIKIQIEFKAYRNSKRTNIFDKSQGDWGEKELYITAQGNFSSKLNWTKLEGEKYDMRGDGGGNAFGLGFLISIPIWIIGICLLLIGRKTNRKKN